MWKYWLKMPLWCRFYKDQADEPESDHQSVARLCLIRLKYSLPHLDTGEMSNHDVSTGITCFHHRVLAMSNKSRTLKDGASANEIYQT